MANVVGVRFKRSQSVTYVKSLEEVRQNDRVLVETERGIEYGYIIRSKIETDDSILDILPTLLRIADETDEAIFEENERLARDAWDIAAEKIREHDLEMKIVDVEYTFDRNKLILCFTADDRVDFRALVRDLAQTFKTRIELRQIGVRDQARVIGGLGPCGQPICCRRYMKDFVPVSIRMAKTQGLSLNPTKISGVCGRLMCCLNYEEKNYQENTKKVPGKGALVLTQEGQGYVVDRDVLQTRVRVHVYKADGSEEEKYYHVEDIEILKKRTKGQPRPELLDSDQLDDHEFVSEGEKKRKNQADLEAQQAGKIRDTEAPSCSCTGCPMSELEIGPIDDEEVINEMDQSEAGDQVNLGTAEWDRARRADEVIVYSKNQNKSPAEDLDEKKVQDKEKTPYGMKGRARRPGRRKPAGRRRRK